MPPPFSQDGLFREIPLDVPPRKNEAGTVLVSAWISQKGLMNFPRARDPITNPERFMSPLFSLHFITLGPWTPLFSSKSPFLPKKIFAIGMFSPCNSVLELLNILNKPSRNQKKTAEMSNLPLSHPRLSIRALPRIDRRILVMVLVPVLVGIALIGFVICITIRLKKRRHKAFGPYEGTLVHPEDLAAQITPYGGSGPLRGRNIPRFSGLTLYCDIYFPRFNDILQYILPERTCELLFVEPMGLGTLPIHGHLLSLQV
jgi:hypothetical protein